MTKKKQIKKYVFHTLHWIKYYKKGYCLMHLEINLSMVKFYVEITIFYVIGHTKISASYHYFLALTIRDMLHLRTFGSHFILFFSLTNDNSNNFLYI